MFFPFLKKQKTNKKTNKTNNQTNTYLLQFFHSRCDLLIQNLSHTQTDKDNIGDKTDGHSNSWVI